MLKLDSALRQMNMKEEVTITATRGAFVQLLLLATAGGNALNNDILGFMSSCNDTQDAFIELNLIEDSTSKDLQDLMCKIDPSFAEALAVPTQESTQRSQS